MFGTRRWKFVPPFLRFSLANDVTHRWGLWRCRIESTDIEAATTLTSNPASTICSRWHVEKSIFLEHKWKPQNLPGNCLRGLERNEGGFQDGLGRYHLQGWLCTKGEHFLSSILFFFLTMRQAVSCLSIWTKKFQLSPVRIKALGQQSWVKSRLKMHLVRTTYKVEACCLILSKVMVGCRRQLVLSTFEASNLYTGSVSSHYQTNHLSTKGLLVGEYQQSSSWWFEDSCKWISVLVCSCPNFSPPVQTAAKSDWAEDSSAKSASNAEEQVPLKRLQLDLKALAS